MKSQRTQGIFFIIISALFFALMGFFVRLAGDLPTMEKAFFRNAVAAVVAIAMLVKSGQKFNIPKGSRMDMFLRCLCGTLGVICNFYAIDKMNIADANILNKLSPFFAIVMSYFILKEKANVIEWATVITAFIGAMFVVKPSFEMSSIYGVIAAFGGLMAGTAYTFVRKMGKKNIPGPLIVFCFSAFSCIVILPVMIMQFKPMTAQQFFILLGAGISASIGQFSITKAYTYAPAKEISVFDYTAVIFSALLGFIFLDQIPDALSILGYIVIIGSAVVKTVLINRSESVKKQQ